ncbi:BZ3501_MvSof-1269-A2-R1_C71g00397 [Microbotryum saponariae]|nr:BZ3501_MvSof-1269-A2-R1_C71g00397 [Microbotryum saponariae]
MDTSATFPAEQLLHRCCRDSPLPLPVFDQLYYVSDVVIAKSDQMHFNIPIRSTLLRQRCSYSQE